MHSMQEVHAAEWPPDLLTADEVEGLLGVDKSTIYRMAADGRLSAIKVGRQWRFPAEPLRELLDGAGASFNLSTSIRSGWIGGLSSSVIEPIVDLAAHLLRVMMVTTDMNGNPVTDVVNPCPWFLSQQDDPVVLSECIDDWKGYAREVDLEPRLTVGSHGFECVRVFIRDGNSLVGMVLAGGIQAPGSDMPGLYELNGEERAHLVAALPRVAATISRIIAGFPLTLRSAS